jgi:hypothetical protein
MVSAILTVKCGASLAALTCGTLAAYMAFTFSITQVLTCSLNRAALRLSSSSTVPCCASRLPGQLKQQQ